MKKYCITSETARNLANQYYIDDMYKSDKQLNKIYKKIRDNAMKGHRSLYYSPMFGIFYRNYVIKDLREKGYSVVPIDYDSDALQIRW